MVGMVSAGRLAGSGAKRWRMALRSGCRPALLSAARTLASSASQARSWAMARSSTMILHASLGDVC